MLIKTRIVSLSLSIMTLSGCMIDGTNNHYNGYQSNDYQHSQLYPESYDTPINYDTQPQNVVVPESYHVGPNASPMSSKDRDRNWVSNQNPMGYTIVIADNEKANRVAGALQKAPKNEHMAEISYQNGGRAFYKGLYGSYADYESAQKALNNLPQDLKQDAEIKSWSSVQQTISE